MKRLPPYIKKVMDNLPTIGRQDVMTFSIFVVVSFIFWVVQSSYEKSDMDYDVALHIENMPAGAVFTTHIPDKLTVTLYDNNIHLANYATKSSLRHLTVDFNRYADVAGNFRISGAELASLIQNELSSTTQITAMYPSLIDARYALTKGKKVPIRLKAKLFTRGNYKDFPARLTPDSVLIHAPSAILDTMTFIETEAIDYRDLTDTLRCKVALNQGLGIKATPDTVSLLVPVMQYVNKTFHKVPIQVKGVPRGKKLILFPRQADVECLANFAHYNYYTNADIRLIVLYDSLRVNPKRQYLPVKFETSLTEADIYNIKLSTPKVEYSLEE